MYRALRARPPIHEGARHMGPENELFGSSLLRQTSLENSTLLSPPPLLSAAVPLLLVLHLRGFTSLLRWPVSGWFNGKLMQHDETGGWPSWVQAGRCDFSL